MTTQEEKKAVIEKFAQSKADTGSSEVQVGLLTQRISTIAGHLKSFPKDKHSQYGLIKLLGKRRSLLRYLKNTDRDSFENVSELIKKG